MHFDAATLVPPMMYVYSEVKVSVLGEDKVGEISEHPVVLQRSIDDPQKLAGRGNDRFARTFLRFQLLIMFPQIVAVLNRHQRALHQRRAPELRPAFSDVSVLHRLI